MDLRSTLALAVASQFILLDFAVAAINDNQAPAHTDLAAYTAMSGENGPLKLNTWMTLNKTATLKVLTPGKNEEPGFNSPDQFLVLNEGTEITALELSADGQRVYLSVDEDISAENPGVNGAEPVIAWVALADVLAANPQEIDTEAMEDLAELGIDLQQGQEFIETDVAARRGGHVRHRGGRGRRGGMTFCLRDVRITAARYTRRVPQGVPMASMAYSRYRAAGWTPVSYSSAPHGTVCFSGGGRSCGKGRRCGHAAIKIGSNAWKGAGIRPTPWLNSRPGKVYYKQGCLKPPGR